VPLLPGRVSAWLGRLMLARTAPTVVVDLPFGYAMRLDLGEYVQCTIALNGEWEGEIFDACVPLVAPGEVVLDVGAHVGYASLRLAAMTGRTGRVIAFEPLPAHRQAVAAQFALNGIAQQLTIVAAAVSDRAGTASFAAPGGANAGTGALTTNGGGTLTVETLRLDDWLEQAGITRVALCKMDIEGAEALALPGLARFLGAGAVGALLLELHPGELPHFGSSVPAIVALLEGHGYRIRWWEQPGEFRDGPPSADANYLLAIAPGRAWP
jgi:FkbM family methyltransferase